MRYKDGEPVKGSIYKTDEFLVKVNKALVRKNKKPSNLNVEVFEFETTSLGNIPFEVNDKCLLKYDDSHIELAVISGAFKPTLCQIFYRFSQSDY